MSRNPPPSDKGWKISSLTDKAGRTYIFSYCNKWDPVKKQSRNAGTRQIGRVEPSGLISFSDRYLSDHPQFRTGDWYYEKNQIIQRSASEIAEAAKTSLFDYREQSLQVGLTYGAWALAQENHLLEDLKEVFGEDLGKELLELGIYQLDSPGSALMNFEDWLALVYLPDAHPIDGRRLSESLKAVNQEKIDAYFKLRHERARVHAQNRRRALKSRDPERYIPPQTLAFDSTSISTYSKTITDAAYGYAKQNPELAQVNLTLVCDYDTGDTVYGYESEGSINDKAIFSEIINRMYMTGFDLNDTLVVTDRGYSTMYNVQKELNLEMKFLTGIPLKEDSVKRAFKKHFQSLRSPAFYSGKYGCASFTYSESWTQATLAGQLTVPVYVHLYYNEVRAAEEKQSLISAIDVILEKKDQGLAIDYDKWHEYSKYLKEVKNKAGKTHWIRDNTAIEKALEFSGCFAIKSNEIKDGFEALRVYRQRNMIEQAFEQFKNKTEGARMFATQTTYLGKLFIHMLAQSLRMMMHMSAIRQDGRAKKTLPGNSLEKAFMQLRALQAYRPLGRNVWLTKVPTKKQRDLLSLLSLPLPPNQLRH